MRPPEHFEFYYIHKYERGTLLTTPRKKGAGLPRRCYSISSVFFGRTYSRFVIQSAATPSQRANEPLIYLSFFSPSGFSVFFFFLKITSSSKKIFICCMPVPPLPIGRSIKQAKLSLRPRSGVFLKQFLGGPRKCSGTWNNQKEKHFFS